jgi:4,5-dihydroxyphthalate decarboxylase
MAKIPVTLAFSRSPLVAPILDGEVEIVGVDLNPVVINPADLFWRQLHYAEFDVSELSLGGLIMQKARGLAQYSIVPAFPSRTFFHTAILINPASGIQSPADLKGKRVGIKEYQQTAAIWMRGALYHEWGVHPSDMEWWMGRRPERSHGTATGFAPPEGVGLSYIGTDDSLGQMLLDGRLDAWLCYNTRSGGFGFGQESEVHSSTLAEGYVDSQEPDITSSPIPRMLFDNPRTEWQRYHAATGLLPMNHGVALRNSLAERYPWLPRNLYDAFRKARSLANRRLGRELEAYTALGAIDLPSLERTQKLFEYGVSATKLTFDTLLGYAREQEIIPQRVDAKDMFFASTLEL